MFQSYALWPHMTVYDNIAFGLKIQKLPRDEVDRRVKDALRMMRIAEYEKRYPNELSGGQQQRVAIARAVASNPKLLLLDEPLSNLHDQVEALTMSTRIALFKAGELSQVSTPVELYMNPIDLQAADFIGNPRINFLEGKAKMESGGLRVVSALGERVFPKSDMTDGALPVTVYANQPAGSETLVSLQAGGSDFLAKQLGLVHYQINQRLYVHIASEKINIYDARSTRLIKRARVDDGDVPA